MTRFQELSGLPCPGSPSFASHPPLGLVEPGCEGDAATAASGVSQLGPHSTASEPKVSPKPPSPATALDSGRRVDDSGTAGNGPRQRRRARRRELRCPLHPEQKLFSVSPKHHLYLTDVGQLMLRGLSKRRADELLAAYRRVLPLTNEWIECFWCDDCASTSWWHVQRHDRHDYSLNKVPRELWEQATGVIRVEGNPTVSQFSRRQARAGGVHGMRQYRFL